jgi:hypothetical protein
MGMNNASNVIGIGTEVVVVVAGSFTGRTGTVKRIVDGVCEVEMWNAIGSRVPFISWMFPAGTIAAK